MPTLLVRNVDAPLHARLTARAAAHRRSLEEEVRELLRQAVARQEPPEHPLDVAMRLFGSKHGVVLECPSRKIGKERPPPHFTDPDDAS